MSQGIAIFADVELLDQLYLDLCGLRRGSSCLSLRHTGLELVAGEEEAYRSSLPSLGDGEAKVWFFLSELLSSLIWW